MHYHPIVFGQIRPSGAFLPVRVCFRPNGALCPQPPHRVPGGPPGGPTWLIITYYTRGKCFRDTLTPSPCLGRASSIASSKGPFLIQITKLIGVDFCWWDYQKKFKNMFFFIEKSTFVCNNTITDGGSTAPLYCWYHTEESSKDFAHWLQGNALWLSSCLKRVPL